MFTDFALLKLLIPRRAKSRITALEQLAYAVKDTHAPRGRCVSCAICAALDEVDKHNVYDL